MSFDNESLRTAEHMANAVLAAQTTPGSSTENIREQPALTTEEKLMRREARMKKIRKKKRKKEKLLLKLEMENEAKLQEGQIVQRVAETPSLHRPHSDISSEIVQEPIPEKKRLKLSIKKPIKSTTAVVSSKKYAKESKISFPINEECTSLTLTPSGRTIIVGFTDGTLRLFDTTGRLWLPNSSSKSVSLMGDPIKSEMSNLFDSDSEGDDDSPSKTGHRSKQRMVASKSFQNYGAVACQIHARGVITSLLMDVDCCEDGKFAFGGVLRGSTELVAVDLSLLEKYHDIYLDEDGNEPESKTDILDLIKVYRHSDAKLKGFGTCIRLKNTDRTEYRLFTGKGIKNMHIWSFIPPQGDLKEPSWQCLYDTPTNGNTITYLNFRRDSNGLLQGISKSDDQKLRIWDLSYEERSEKSPQTEVKSVIKQLAQKAEKESCEDRPKRPPYIDVLSTENALSVCGSYVFSGGDSMYNKMGVMFLDVEDIQSQFNHTELALPNANGVVETPSFGRSARSGRQQRGDLKSVVRVAGLDKDADHVLLELSDQSMVHYCHKGNQSSLAPLSFPSSNQTDRHICVTRISSGSAMLLTSSYEENKGRGAITMKFLSEKPEGGSIGSSARTGFTELFSNQQKIRLKKTKQTSKLSPDPSYKRKMTKSLDSLVADNQRIKSVKETGSGKGSKHGKEPASIKEHKPVRELMPVSIIPSKKSPPSAKRDDRKTAAASVDSPTAQNPPVLAMSTPMAKSNDRKTAVASVDSPTAQNPPVLAMSTPMAKSNCNVIPFSKGRKEMNNTDLMVTPEPKKMMKVLTPEPKNTMEVSPSSASLSNAASAIPKETSPHQKENVSQAQSQSPVSRKQVQGNNDNTSSPSMKTSSEMRTEPVGIAVSPEQLKKAESPPPPLTIIDTSKSITKFFSKSKEANKISNSALKPAAKINKIKAKKVQFKQVDSTAKESEGRALVLTELPPVPRKRKLLQEVNSTRKVPVVPRKKVPRKKRALQEADVELALASLRKIASEGRSAMDLKVYPPMEDFQGVSGKAHQEMEEYLATCHKRKRPKFMRYTSQPSVSVRTGVQVPFYKNTGTVFASTNMNQSHFEARRALAIHHRASHERLRSAIISSGERAMNIISCYDGSTTHVKSQLTEVAREEMTKEMLHHRETLRDMLERQRMEASSLANSQMMEKGEKVPELAVSFPFPEIFDQVHSSTVKFISMP